MKRLLFCAVFLLPVFAFAQNAQPFIISGKLGTLNAQVFLLYQVGSNKILDSAKVVNGAFEFKGDLIYPSFGELVMDYKTAGSSKLDEATADKLVFCFDKGTTTIQSPDSAY